MTSTDFVEINRRVTAAEYEAAIASARAAGLWRIHGHESPPPAIPIFCTTFAMHIRQPEVAALEAIRQPRVIDAQLMEDGGVADRRQKPHPSATL